mmetsp:Transcript_5461/g.5598  ORF Transcript_5461/g.5598 Transcript_5461/m.5598 type:complete len:457 (+) Transcript_5461:1-1371(+)
MGNKKKQKSNNQKKKNNAKPKMNKVNAQNINHIPTNHPKNTGNHSSVPYKNQRRKKKKGQSKQHMEEFKAQVKELGMRILEVSGDGNCFFRSVSDQLEGKEDNHPYYRSLAVDYIEANKDFIKFFIEDDKPVDKYIEDMKKDGTWGGNIEIYSLSMSLKVNFFIHLYNRPLYIVKNLDTPSRNVFLSYHDGMHYNSVRLLEDFSSGETPPEIQMSLLTGVSQTQDSNALKDEDEGLEEEVENEEEGEGEDNEEKDDKENSDEEQGKEDTEDTKEEKREKKNKEEKVSQESQDEASGEEEGDEEIELYTDFKGVKVKSITELDSVKQHNTRSNKTKEEKNSESIRESECLDKILNEDGCLYESVKKSKHVKRDDQKVYDQDQDIKGKYFEPEGVFFCDLNELYDKFGEILDSSQPKQGSEEDKAKSNKNGKNKNLKANGGNDKDIENITKKVELIFI